MPRFVLRTSVWIGRLAIACGLISSAMAQSRDPFREMRWRMVDENIVREGITNPRVLRVMRNVPRHEFVPVLMRPQAYFDLALAIGYRQTISPPFIVAYMTQTIDPQPSDRVLEIGTGSGYQAAILSGLVRDVYTIEIVEPLSRSAQRVLKRLKYDNVHTRIGDGYQGWPEEAPFDNILVTCSPEHVPTPLIEQLSEGGKMIIPIGERYQQVFHLLEKKNGQLVTKKLLPTLFVPMTGVAEEDRHVKPDPLHPRIVNAGFEIDADADGRTDNWHYQRQTTLVSDAAAPEGSHYLLIQNQDPGRGAQLLQGFPVDGRKVHNLAVSVRVKVDRVPAGTQSNELPALVVHFYDSIRRPIAWSAVGPWLHVSDWTQQLRTIPVPEATREAIMRIGLNGATGTICVDDVRLTVAEH